MKILTKTGAANLIKWYDEYGVNNWGGWTNYPDLPTGASYHSFDNCQCRIKLDELLTLESGEEFDVIADGRRIPGKYKASISIYELRDYIKTDEEKITEKIEGWGRDYERAVEQKNEEKKWLTLSDADKLWVQKLDESFLKIAGKPKSKFFRKIYEQECFKFPAKIILDENHWMSVAANFKTKEDYIIFNKTTTK